MRRRALHLVICCLAWLPRSILPQTPALPASPSPILVELFTSEGCSDCPPADELLRRISNTRTPQGQPIFVLSEHVTYWDRLGWKDSFSDEAFTARQNGYGRRFNLDSVYTPQMVVNGAKQFVGNNSKSLRDTLLAETPGPHVDLRILSVERSPDALTVHFSAANVATSAPLDILAAITDDLDETHVERGENGGRTLTHVSVARSFGRLAEVRSDSEQTARIPWPAALRGSPEAARHLLLFAQQRNYGKVVGATSKPLPKSGAATEADEKSARNRVDPPRTL